MVDIQFATVTEYTDDRGYDQMLDATTVYIDGKAFDQFYTDSEIPGRTLAAMVQYRKFAESGVDIYDHNEYDRFFRVDPISEDAADASEYEKSMS